jgi:predicted negative regulator of RcsB-dependent stress response
LFTIVLLARACVFAVARRQSVQQTRVQRRAAQVVPSVNEAVQKQQSAIASTAIKLATANNHPPTFAQSAVDETVERGGTDLLNKHLGNDRIELFTVR